eukprot:1888866-Prymnesium_polylepis.1
MPEHFFQVFLNLHCLGVHVGGLTDSPISRASQRRVKPPPTSGSQGLAPWSRRRRPVSARREAAELAVWRA